MLKKTEILTSILELNIIRRSAREARKAGSHAQLNGSQSCRVPRREIDFGTKPISLLESPDALVGFPMRIWAGVVDSRFDVLGTTC